MKKVIIPILILVIMLGIRADTSYALNDGSKITVSLLGKYDSADTATIRSVDTDKKEIRFRNHETGKTYTLTYDNTSMMYDVYDEVLSPRRLEQGQIVDVTFLKSTKHITTLNVSKDAWVVENTRSHDLVRNDGTAIIKDQIYKMDTRTLVLAENQPSLAEDVLSTDTICVRGIGKDIYSVVVTGGHGYVSLSSDTVENQSLVGAWIELGNEVIYKISPNMMLSAPEGDYKLQILGNGANYQSQVNVARNRETVVDTSNITKANPKQGLVTFEITPETAEVFVDGKRMLTGVPQAILYGYHNLKLMADGYISQSKYLKVGTPNSVIQIEMEKDEDAAASTSSENIDASVSKSSTDKSTDNASAEKSRMISSNSAATASSKTVSENSASDRINKVIEGYKIYIDEPYGAEVYFDGGYIGMVPTSMTKISGTHEIILKKDGYQTKSYRINIDTDKSDLSYKFPELIKEKKNDDPGSGSSSSSSASTASSEDSSKSSSSGDSEGSEDSEESTDSSSESSSSGSSASSASSEDTDSGSSSSTDSGSGSSSKEEEASDAASTASKER